YKLLPVNYLFCCSHLPHWSGHYQTPLCSSCPHPTSLLLSAPLCSPSPIPPLLSSPLLSAPLPPIPPLHSSFTTLSISLSLHTLSLTPLQFPIYPMQSFSPGQRFCGVPVTELCSVCMCVRERERERECL